MLRNRHCGRCSFLSERPGEAQLRLGTSISSSGKLGHYCSCCSASAFQGRQGLRFACVRGFELSDYIKVKVLRTEMSKLQGKSVWSLKMLPLKSQCPYDFYPKGFFSPQLKLPGNWDSQGHSHPYVSLIWWPVPLAWTLGNWTTCRVCPKNTKSKGAVRPDKDEQPRGCQAQEGVASSTSQVLEVWVRCAAGLEPGTTCSNFSVLGKVTSATHQTTWLTGKWCTATRLQELRYQPKLFLMEKQISRTISQKY